MRLGFYSLWAGGPFFLCVAWQELKEIPLGGAYLGQRFGISSLYYAITQSDKLFTVVSVKSLDADEN